jgi:hypothetical protein
MQYDHILVDVSNLYFRLKGKCRNSLDITKKLIDYTNNEIKKHLHKEGTLWLLFDALSYSDLGESKAFVHGTERKQILPDYKMNRVRSEFFLETMELYRKYYFYRGDQVKLVYSDSYEADDYLEPILDRITGNIALISNDHDFCRYLKPGIDLINKNFDIPFTTEDFERIYQFYPSKASVILYLTLFGDKSDCITGVIQVKKAKFTYPDGIKMLCLGFLNWVNENNLSIEGIIKMFKTSVYYEIQNKKNKNAFDELYLQLKINDLKLPMMETLYKNISIIRSQLEGKNIDDLIHSNPENSTTNAVIEQSIFGTFRFGKA